MWLLWDWEEIHRKYVKHTSRIIFLFLSLFLMMSMYSKASFDTLNVYNFTNKRPELVYVYSTIILPAFPYLKKALLLCLIIIPILIIVTWRPDTKNSRFFNILYNFALILFGLVVSAYMLAIIFFLRSTNRWFIFFATVLLLIIATLIINHLYYKKNKEEFSNITKSNKIMLTAIILSALLLEVCIAFPKAVEAKKALEADYERVCYDITIKSYGSIFSESYDVDSKYFKDVRDELQHGSKSYVILNFINLYSNKDFTVEEIINAYNNLENTDLSLNSESWYAILELYDARPTHNSIPHIYIYDMYRNPLYGYYTGAIFYENVLRRLQELGYTTNLENEYIDKEILDDACKYVYDIFESGLCEPIKEVNLTATYSNGEYIFTSDEGSTYFVANYFETSDGFYIKLYHTVGYYFDENTIINIEGIDNYNISNLEYEFQGDDDDEYKYADMFFDITIN